MNTTAKLTRTEEALRTIWNNHDHRSYHELGLTTQMHVSLLDRGLAEYRQDQPGKAHRLVLTHAGHATLTSAIWRTHGSV